MSGEKLRKFGAAGALPGLCPRMPSLVRSAAGPGGTDGGVIVGVLDFDDVKPLTVPARVAAAAIAAAIEVSAAISDVLTADRMKTHPTIEPVNLVRLQPGIEPYDLALQTKRLRPSNECHNQIPGSRVVPSLRRDVENVVRRDPNRGEHIPRFESIQPPD